MSNLKTLELVFENVDSVIIPGEYVTNMNLSVLEHGVVKYGEGDIRHIVEVSQGLIDLDLTECDVKTVFEADGVEMGTLADRLMQWNDITEIVYTYAIEGGEVKKTVYPFWNEEDDEDSRCQRCVQASNGHILVAFDKTMAFMSIQEYEKNLDANYMENAHETLKNAIVSFDMTAKDDDENDLLSDSKRKVMQIHPQVSKDIMMFDAQYMNAENRDNILRFVPKHYKAEDMREYLKVLPTLSFPEYTDEELNTMPLDTLRRCIDSAVFPKESAFTSEDVRDMYGWNIFVANFRSMNYVSNINALYAGIMYYKTMLDGTSKPQTIGRGEDVERQRLKDRYYTCLTRFETLKKMAPALNKFYAVA